MKYLNYDVEVFRHPQPEILNDAAFTAKLEKITAKGKFDCIFTFNYFPVISKFAAKQNLNYIVWVFDSPHLTLYSDSIFNSCNHIFCFDRSEVLRLQNYGAEHVYHMPLAVNTDKLHRLLGDNSANPKYSYDVTFLGKLYNDEYNFFDQIKDMPEYYRGFFDGIIRSQMNIFGYDLASDIITDELIRQMHSFVGIQLIDEVFLKEKDLFLNIFHKKITVVERLELLQLISSRYHVTHFAPATDPSLTNVDYKGYAQYNTDMPIIFRNSKINLNITLRSIQSGIPLRCMDIMGAGGFLLSNYQPELAEYFEVGKEVVLYESREDLMQKINYYLHHEEERQEIARCGQRKVEENYSYRKVLPKIFSTVFH
jgi:spore maturation protein CgeB